MRALRVALTSLGVTVFAALAATPCVPGQEHVPEKATYRTHGEGCG